MITRRSALTASLTTLLAAGTASMLPPAANASQERTTVRHRPLTISPVVDRSDLIAESKRASAESKRTLPVVFEASAALIETMTEEQARLFLAYDEAAVTHHLAAQEYDLAELCRHFGGFAPAIFAVMTHIHETEGRMLPGECCEAEAD